MFRGQLTDAQRGAPSRVTCQGLRVSPERPKRDGTKPLDNRIKEAYDKAFLALLSQNPGV